MGQNSVSHEARAKEVLLRYVIDRKLHPNDNGCSLRRGDDTLRRTTMTKIKKSDCTTSVQLISENMQVHITSSQEKTWK